MICVSSTHYSLILNGTLLETFKAKCGVRQGDPMSPLLFVIGMEYLSKILIATGDAKDVYFHSRCSKLKLNHLVFAKDLMLFYKGDMHSIKTLCQGVELFSSSSGLEANNSKSGIYLAGVSDNFRMLVARSLEFTFESLPGKYLGMPLTSKWYTIADWECMVDKMTNQIRSWFARNLSYTARLQLVNSILISISNYWCQTVILPKRAVNQINTICRSYLWHGDTNDKSPRNVKWEKVPRPKGGWAGNPKPASVEPSSCR